MSRNKALRGQPLPAGFFARDATGVARDLLGCILATRSRGVVTAGRIVEVEAYLGAIDPAAHSYGGRKTARTATMFGPPGHAYVYFIYGMHWCVNVVTEPEGTPSAVLIRGIEPVEGEATMRRRRKGREDYSGPGKVCQALGITGKDDGRALDGTRVGIWGRGHEDAMTRGRAKTIRVTPRIGITRATDWPLRFVLEE